MTMTESTAPDDFAAAKKVFDELKDLPRERQERVVRWVSETLGIQGAPAAQGTAPMMSGPPQLIGPVGPTGGGTRDIRTFVTEKAPTSDNQFAAVVAYYYRFEAPTEHRRTTISGADLQEAARLAGRKRLSNPRQTLKNAKGLGYLDNPGRGEYSINTVGENLVAMTLPGGADAPRPGLKRGAKRSKKSVGRGKKRGK